MNSEGARSAADAAPERPFVHLHTHTEYSLFDGLSRITELADAAARDGMPALAITDHGNLFGALKFHRACRKAGVKPILGCEAYVAPGSRLEKNPDKDNHHLVLLARNRDGFRNLIRLTSIAYDDGFYSKPRMDLELLDEHRDGLIALSACPKGVLPRAVLGEGGDPVAVAERYRELFGTDSYFLEIMDHGSGDCHPRLADLERRITEGVLSVSRKTGIEVVGTNDSHYFRPEDHAAHDVRLAISTNKTLNDSKRLVFDSKEFFFKSSRQMADVFGDCMEAYHNTRAVADRIEEFDLVDSENLLPRFETPDGSTPDAYIGRAAENGLAARLDEPEAHGVRPERSAYEDRLRLELEVIRKTGYPAYFLIVEDFVRFARKKRIPVGPGRGSAAGSLVAYCLGITDVDPLVHGLLFERFLNPERVSPPDIDVDFCELRRDEVLDYVSERYGKDRVASIISFGTLQARAAVRDVGRTLSFPAGELDRLAKAIPERTTLAEHGVPTPSGSGPSRSGVDVARLFRLARRLEGLPRHEATHPAGVVIAPRTLTEILPLERRVEGKDGEKDGAEGRHKTQWDMKDCEAAGLFKMDFLGLRTLTTIEDCARAVDEDRDALRDGDGDIIRIIRNGRFEKVPPEPEVFALFGRADTSGIFQFESDGMRSLLKRYGPEKLDDLTALNALYRPGPLESGMTDAFVEAKHRGGLATMLDERVRKLFPETRGLIVFQEQVMLAAVELAGYTLGQADILRKAMGKKDPAVMESEEARFVGGAVDRGLSRDVARKTFDHIKKFAGYGFNRSHAVGYAIVAYVSGWLKTRYPRHFLASQLTSQQRAGDRSGMARHRVEAEAAGIRVRPPDLRSSASGASVEGDAVRWGLAGVKGVAGRAAAEIVRARKKLSGVPSLAALFEELDLSAVNKGSVESLVQSGAMDFLNVPRSRIFAAVPGLVATAERSRRRRDGGSSDLWGNGAVIEDHFPDAAAWSETERLAREQEAFGFFWTGHPAPEFRRGLGRSATGTVKSVAASRRDRATLVGVAREVRKRKTRDGRAMASFRLEDETGEIPVVVFPDAYSGLTPPDDGEGLVIRGEVKPDRDSGNRSANGEPPGMQLIAEKVLRPDEAAFGLVRKISLEVREPERMIGRVAGLLDRFEGRIQVALRLRDGDREVELGTASGVRLSRDFLREAFRVLGEDAVLFDGRPVPRFAVPGSDEADAASGTGTRPAPVAAGGQDVGQDVGQDFDQDIGGSRSARSLLADGGSR